MIRSSAPTNRKARRQRQREVDAFERKLNRYGLALIAKGLEDREVARALYYVMRYGFAAVEGPGHVEFDTPSCGDEDCVKPEHQRLEHS